MALTQPSRPFEVPREAPQPRIEPREIPSEPEPVEAPSTPAPVEDPVPA